MGHTNNKRVFRKVEQLQHALLRLLKPLTVKLLNTETGDSRLAIPISENTMRRLEKEWARQLQLRQAGVMSSPLSFEESHILQEITKKTQHRNRNNVTRTQAYWAAYQANPTIHWALLAHLVSRNGGWCMTDLRGDLFPQLLNEEQSIHIFAFLERANALIFHDAYPQLLLYEESRKRKRSLFHLLPHLGVSAWMQPVWHDFWSHPESAVLTISLIVNEQNYIEQRVVHNKHFQQTVLDKPLFKTQAWLQLNQVFFPLIAQEPVNIMGLTPMHLAGLILENFSHLSERIEFGKSLYAILFGIGPVLQGVQRFTERTPHTGSRSDYWPHLFAAIRKAPPDITYQERLDGSMLKTGAMPFYSPTLDLAWPDRKLEPVELGDWFVNVQEPLQHMQPIPVPFPYDLTRDAYFGLNKIELAILAAQALKIP
ncbi:DUF2515 family protein [Paenibacillus sp. SI8]|uniref:DUF2515 family protein n=1 Tax=unclassified Paenibacillus TaxID=185978 RepID=UPI0034679A24